jgi:hypothetical protein
MSKFSTLRKKISAIPKSKFKQLSEYLDTEIEIADMQTEVLEIMTNTLNETKRFISNE